MARRRNGAGGRPICGWRVRTRCWPRPGSRRWLGLLQHGGLSRTSFYWHFPDREALLAALVSRWRNTNTAALLARVEAPAASVTEAILNLFDAWVEPEVFDSAAEFASAPGPRPTARSMPR